MLAHVQCQCAHQMPCAWHLLLRRRSDRASGGGGSCRIDWPLACAPLVATMGLPCSLPPLQKISAGSSTKALACWQRSALHENYIDSQQRCRVVRRAPRVKRVNKCIRQLSHLCRCHCASSPAAPRSGLLSPGPTHLALQAATALPAALAPWCAARPGARRRRRRQLMLRCCAQLAAHLLAEGAHVLRRLRARALMPALPALLAAGGGWPGGSAPTGAPVHAHGAAARRCAARS